jgi:hypothetical protein
MKSRSTMVFACMSALTGALVLGSSLQGCQDGGTGTGGGGGTTTSNGTTNPTTTTSGTQSTTSSTGSTMNTTSSTTSGGGTYTEVTVDQITNSAASGHVGEKTAVELKGVVAMSHKFLISQSKTSNSCLWGIFLSAPGLTETKEYTGILATSYGTMATVADGGTKAFCPVPGVTGPAGDAFPDDVKPGDVFDVKGKTSYFNINNVSAGSCSKPTDSMDKQWQVSQINPGDVTKTGTATPPTPHALSAADITTLVSQNAQDFYDKWGGVKVRVTNVTATPQAGQDGGTQITDQYGHILLAGSNLQVGDKLYYQGLLASKKDPCHMGPAYANPMTMFTQIDGFVYLDFCTWNIQPDNRCVDLQPPSDDCAGNTCP